jgi:hypothetical protein
VKIQRYRPTPDAQMLADEAGGWVKFDDVAALSPLAPSAAPSEIERLKADMAELRRICTARIEELEATSIPLTKAEIQSGHNRVQWAENLIRQLPTGHNGRDSWLLNYGTKAEDGQ